MQDQTVPVVGEQSEDHEALAVSSTPRVEGQPSIVPFPVGSTTELTQNVIMLLTAPEVGEQSSALPALVSTSDAPSPSLPPTPLSLSNEANQLNLQPAP